MAGVWMTSYPEEMVQRMWVFWKDVSWDWTIEAGIKFWPLKDVFEFFGSLPTEILDISRCTARWGGVSTVWLVKTFKNCASLFKRRDVHMISGQYSGVAWLFENISSESSPQQNTIGLRNARVHSLSKTFLFQAIQFIQTFLTQLIQVTVRIDFVYTQLNVKTVLFQIIQFSVSTVSMSMQFRKSIRRWDTPPTKSKARGTSKSGMSKWNRKTRYGWS